MATGFNCNCIHKYITSLITVNHFPKYAAPTTKIFNIKKADMKKKNKKKTTVYLPGLLKSLILPPFNIIKNNNNVDVRIIQMIQ